MRYDVIVDSAGKVVGSMRVDGPTPDGVSAGIAPAHESHVLHQVEVTDDFASLAPDELHRRLEEHVATLRAN